MFLSFSLFFAGSDEVPGGADETARLHGRPAEFHLPAESGTSAGKPSVRRLSLSFFFFFTQTPEMSGSNFSFLSWCCAVLSFSYSDIQVKLYRGFLCII